jgi:hypothetical protein
MIFEIWDDFGGPFDPASEPDHKKEARTAKEAAMCFFDSDCDEATWIVRSGERYERVLATRSTSVCVRPTTEAALIAGEE